MSRGLVASRTFSSPRSRRFHALLETGKLHLVLEDDRFARARPIVLNEMLASVAFRVETDNAQAHTARLRLSGAAGRYVVRADGAQVAAVDVVAGRDSIVELPIAAGTPPVDFSIMRAG
jgi:hypothetical protein